MEEAPSTLCLRECEGYPCARTVAQEEVKEETLSSMLYTGSRPHLAGVWGFGKGEEGGHWGCHHLSSRGSKFSGEAG